MKAEKYEITIIDMRSWRRWLRNIVTIVVCIFAPISIDVFVGSSPMQWAGFIVGVIAVVVAASGEYKKNTYTSVVAARARLDEIEREVA